MLERGERTAEAERIRKRTAHRVKVALPVFLQCATFLLESARADLRTEPADTRRKENRRNTLYFASSDVKS